MAIWLTHHHLAYLGPLFREDPPLRLQSLPGIYTKGAAGLGPRGKELSPPRFRPGARLGSLQRPQHVRGGDHRPGVRQRLRALQGRLRRRRCPPRRLPLHRGPPPAPGRHGGHGAEGQLRGRRGAEQEGHPHAQVPHRARHHHQLGRHGEDLAPLLLQRAARGARGAPDPAHRGAPQPQGQPREDDPDHVRDLQRAGHVRGHPGRALPLRLRPHHRHRAGLGRRRHAQRAHLRGLRSAPRHHAPRPGRPRPHRLPHEDPHREGLLLRHHRREGDRARHQGEALLRGPRLRERDGHGRLLLLAGEELRAARRAGHHHRQRALPLPRDPLPALLHRHGVGRHPRDHLQLHHEVRHRHPQGPLRQQRALGRHHHVPRHRRQDAEGDHGAGPQHHEDQNHRPPGAEILRVDRRLHPGLALHLPADVDQQTRVRRGRALHRPPEMLLSPPPRPRRRGPPLGAAAPPGAPPALAAPQHLQRALKPFLEALPCFSGLFGGLAGGGALGGPRLVPSTPR